MLNSKDPKKPADLDLHCFPKKYISRLSMVKFWTRTHILIKDDLNAVILTEYKSVVFIHV